MTDTGKGSGPKISKGVISQYLRTDCKRQLFLSIFAPLRDEAPWSGLGLPSPAKWRPGIVSITKEGRDLESRRFDEIAAVFQGCVRNFKVDTKKEAVKAQGSFLDVLSNGVGSPYLMVEGEFEASALTNAFYSVLGIPAEKAAQLPRLANLRPDIIVALPADWAFPGERRVREVLPNGDAREFGEADARIRLMPVDIKHAEHMNASYAIEVTLYSVLLALWLEVHQLQHQYAVVDCPALWTLDKAGVPLLTSLKDKPLAVRVHGFLERLEVVEFDQYVVSMLKIFREDLMEVCTLPNWQVLEPHVGSYCGMCDFFAHAAWAPKNKETGERKIPEPEHCSIKVKELEHLSQVPELSRGMARTLADSGVTTVGHLCDELPESPKFQNHNRLQAERRILPRRAQCLRDGINDNTGRQCATLPKFSHVSAYITLNFDAATGLTTGMAVYGNYLPHRAYREDQPPPTPTLDPKTRPDAWVVESKTEEAEYKALLRVMYYLRELFARASADNRNEDRDKLTLQVYFWDRRQFEHFRTVVGRHLIRLVGNEDLGGLVWLFPPEELLENHEYVATPPVSLIKDAVKRLKVLPVAHVHTLLGVGEALLGDDADKSVMDFFREPLSDAIPKERIYEIWGDGEKFNKQDQTTWYLRTLRTHVMTLVRITSKLQKEHRAELTAEAPNLKIMELPNFRGVSIDGQLWILHARLDEQTQITERKILWGRDPDELEAEYVSIRLTKHLVGDARLEVLAALELPDEPTLRVDEVSESSRNSKLKEVDGVALFLDQQPGLLNQKVRRLKNVSLPPNTPPWQWNSYVGKALACTIERFDRIHGYIVTRWDPDWAPVRNAIVSAGYNLTTHVSLVPEFPFNKGAERKEKFIRLLGNPAIAAPHAQSLVALSKAKPPKPQKVTPTLGAELVWDPQTVLARASKWSNADVEEVLTWLRAAGQRINESQERAIRHALAHGLTRLWGPPGTGKTNTGAGIVGGELWLARQRQTPRRILVTGPNYQAVENFYRALMPLLQKMGPTAVKVRWVKRRAEPSQIELDTLSYAKVAKEGGKGVMAYAQLREELTKSDTPVVVFAVTAQLYNVAGFDDKSSSAAFSLFDFVMIDEASQVDVATAIGAFALTSPGGRAVLLGDHLQMSPITQVTPPKGCEYLVGSILDYYRGRYPKLPQQELLENYRSGEGLVAFARQIGYPLALEAVHKQSQIALAETVVKTNDWPIHLPWSEVLTALLAPERSTLALTYRDGKSGQANEFEARLVAAALWAARRFVRQGLAGRSDETPGELADQKYFWTRMVGVVTPHRAQRAAVTRLLRETFPDDDPVLIEDAVDTVERFQGGERDLILVSFGVGDPDVIESEEEFLLGLNRTNVAISRARAKAVVIVSNELSYHLPEDVEVVRTARAVKGFVHQYCDQRQSFGVPDGNVERVVTLRWRD